MNVGLFAMLAGFLLPLALVVRLTVLLAEERGRGFTHPLILVLWTELLLALVPVVALAPSVWVATTGRTIEDNALLFEFTATGWGMAKLAVNVAGVLLADAVMPRIAAQLTQEPATGIWPTRHVIARDLGVLAICLVLAGAAAVTR